MHPREMEHARHHALVVRIEPMQSYPGERAVWKVVRKPRRPDSLCDAQMAFKFCANC